MKKQLNKILFMDILIYNKSEAGKKGVSRLGHNEGRYYTSISKEQDVSLFCKLVFFFTPEEAGTKDMKKTIPRRALKHFLL